MAAPGPRKHLSGLPSIQERRASRAFSLQTLCKIRDPDLLKNSRPNPAKFVTRSKAGFNESTSRDASKSIRTVRSSAARKSGRSMRFVSADVRAAGRTQDPKSHQASMFGVAVCRRRRRLHESCKRHPPDHTTGPISPRPSTRVPPAESERVSRLPSAPRNTVLAASSWLYLAHRHPVRPDTVKTPILGRVTP